METVNSPFKGPIPNLKRPSRSNIFISQSISMRSLRIIWESWRNTISIGGTLSYWGNSSLRTITSGTEWPTYYLWRISPKSWSQLKLPGTWASCLTMAEPQNLWRETLLLSKMKSNKSVINTSTSKLDTSTTVDPVLWIVWKLSLRKTLMLTSTIKKCWRRVRTTNYGLNILRKKIQPRSKSRDMPGS